MGTWTNDDGLFIKLGTSEGALAKGGAVNTGGARLNQVVVEVLWSDLAATGTEQIIEDNVGIPDGAHVEKAEFYVETAFAGASATLTFGLMNRDRSTQIDPNGFDDTIAVGALTAGATVACDGDLIGTTVPTGGLLTATEGTAAFTAGKGYLSIFYYTT